MNLCTFEGRGVIFIQCVFLHFKLFKLFEGSRVTFFLPILVIFKYQIYVVFLLIAITRCNRLKDNI